MAYNSIFLLSYATKTIMQMAREQLWSHFVLTAHLLMLYKLSIDIQLHVNSVSVKIQIKRLLTVSMFRCSKLLTYIQLSVHWVNIF